MPDKFTPDQIALFLACVFTRTEFDARNREIASGKWDAELTAFVALTAIYKADDVGMMISGLCTGDGVLK